VDATEPPHAFSGSFKTEDEENMYIVGTVGDKIGHNLAIPKRRILYIDWQKVKDLR
jgi:hypothetical protein